MGQRVAVDRYIQVLYYNTMAKDLLLISAPLRPMEYPPMALALLKSILHTNGYDVALSDASLEYWKHCGGTSNEFLLRTMPYRTPWPGPWRR